MCGWRNHQANAKQRQKLQVSHFQSSSECSEPLAKRHPEQMQASCQSTLSMDVI
jgi:hypothetical protein